MQSYSGLRLKKGKYCICFYHSLKLLFATFRCSVMSGAIIFIQEDLKITKVQEEVLVGSLSIVSLLGSLAGGRTSDAIGRKWTMGLAAVVFQTGAAVMTLAPSFQILMVEDSLLGLELALES